MCTSGIGKLRFDFTIPSDKLQFVWSCLETNSIGLLSSHFFRSFAKSSTVVWIGRLGLILSKAFRCGLISFEVCPHELIRSEILSFSRKKLELTFPHIADDCPLLWNGGSCSIVGVSSIIVRPSIVAFDCFFVCCRFVHRLCCIFLHFLEK